MSEVLGKTRGDGFASYMMKRAAGVPGTEHYDIPLLGNQAETPAEDVQRIDIEIEGEAAAHLEKVAEAKEFPNAAALINEALHFYLNMCDAVDNGYNELLMVNEETREVIKLDIS